jgi:hypothetical protein
MDVTKYADGYQIVRKPVGFTVIGPDGSRYECKTRRGAELSIRHNRNRGTWPPEGAM